MKSRHLLGKDVNGVYSILKLEARCRQNQMFPFIWRIAAAKILSKILLKILSKKILSKGVFESRRGKNGKWRKRRERRGKGGN